MNCTVYGVIDEDVFTFRSPRVPDFTGTLRECWEEAASRIEEGWNSQLSIVRCRWSSRHEMFVEDDRRGCVEIDAQTAEGMFDD